MARIITFASSKGGTGKTVLVANVGAAMAKLGKKVAIVDADIAMANLGLITGLGEHKTTLHEVLAGEAILSSAIYDGPNGLKILPSGISVDDVKKADLDGLKKAVHELSRSFEILLIDSPSGMDRDAITALKIAYELVIVVTPDIASLSNAHALKTIAERLGVKPVGLVITRTTEKELDLSREEITSSLELPVLGTIPEDESVRRSTAFGDYVVNRSPKSRAAVELKKLAATMAGRKA